MRNAVAHKLYIRVLDHIPTHSQKHTTSVHSHNISQCVVFNFDNIFAGIVHFGFDDLGDSTRNNRFGISFYFFMPTSRWTASDGSGAFIFQSNFAGICSFVPNIHCTRTNQHTNNSDFATNTQKDNLQTIAYSLFCFLASTHYTSLAPSPPLHSFGAVEPCS